jgi:branched-chain amino acid transport system substrate-binding protein
MVSPTSEELPKHRFLAELAEEEINAYCERQAVDLRFEFVVASANSDVERALELTESYHADGINLVIGYWSSMICRVREFAESQGIVIISPSSTSPLLALNDSVFRLAPSDLHQARVIARMLESKGVEAVVILERGD